MAIKRFICKNCGAVNQADLTAADLSENEELLLECMLLEGFEWILPAGKITPALGPTIYVSANGEHLSRTDYEDTYGLDPEIALQFMRGRLAKTFILKSVNLTNKKHAKASRALMLNMTDDDDWTA